MNKNMKKALQQRLWERQVWRLRRCATAGRTEDARISAIEEAVMNNREYGDRKAYLVGGGLASMAAAAYLVRDCKFPAKQITIYEGMHILGEAMTASVRRKRIRAAAAYAQRRHIENFWELFVHPVPAPARTQRDRGNPGL